MAEETPLESFLVELATRKGVEFRYSSGSIELFKGDKNIGSLSYSIIPDISITTVVTRSGKTTKEAKSIQIHSLTINPEHQGQKLGSLLLADAIRIGLENQCEYSTLDDMSDKSQDPFVNIYATFGFVHADVATFDEHGKLIKTFPEKQLEIPVAKQLLKNYKRIFAEKKGGQRKTKRKKLIPICRVVFHNGVSKLRKHNPVYSTHRNW